MKKTILSSAFILLALAGFSQASKHPKDSVKAALNMAPAVWPAPRQFIVVLDEKGLADLYDFIVSDIYNEKGRQQYLYFLQKQVREVTPVSPADTAKQKK